MDLIKKCKSLYVEKENIYIKPVTQVIIVDIPICHQMLSGSGNTGYDANTQKPFTPPSTSTSDEELEGEEDLDGAKINYWY